MAGLRETIGIDLAINAIKENNNNVHWKIYPTYNPAQSLTGNKWPQGSHKQCWQVILKCLTYRWLIWSIWFAWKWHLIHANWIWQLFAPMAISIHVGHFPILLLVELTDLSFLTGSNIYSRAHQMKHYTALWSLGRCVVRSVETSNERKYKPIEHAKCG